MALVALLISGSASSRWLRRGITRKPITTVGLVQRIPDRTLADAVLFSQMIAGPLHEPADLGPASVAKDVAKERRQLSVVLVLLIKPVGKVWKVQCSSAGLNFLADHLLTLKA
jgi:hypothetical protein